MSCSLPIIEIRFLPTTTVYESLIYPSAPADKFLDSDVSDRIAMIGCKELFEKGPGNPVRNVGIKKTRLLVLNYYRECRSPPSEVVLDPIGELSTRLNGHFCCFRN